MPGFATILFEEGSFKYISFKEKNREAIMSNSETSPDPAKSRLDRSFYYSTDRSF
jgi:hypothetical protein